MIGGRGLTKGGPDGRYRRAGPEGRGDPEDAGRVLRQGPSQSVAGGPRGHCGRLGPQSETATRRAGRVDPWLVRRVASLRGWTRTRVRVTSVDVVAVNLRCRRDRMPWVEKGAGGGSGWISSSRSSGCVVLGRCGVPGQCASPRLERTGWVSPANMRKERASVRCCPRSSTGRRSPCWRATSVAPLLEGPSSTGAIALTLSVRRILVSDLGRG